MMIIAITLIAFIVGCYFRNTHLSKNYLRLAYIFLTANMLYVVGSKNITKATDFHAYMLGFDEYKHTDIIKALVIHVYEPIFTTLSWLLMRMFTPEFTFVLIVFITNIIIAIGIYSTFEDKYLAVFSLFFYTYSPIFLIASTNIIRQMLVIGLLILLFNVKGIKKLLLLLFPFIHFSSLLIIPIVLMKKWLKVKYALAMFGLAILLYITNMNRFLFGSIPYFKRYTSASYYAHSGSHGNRLDFLVFTIVIVILALVLYKFKLVSKSVVNYVLLTGTLFGLLGFLAYSERTAIYNWIFLIILVPYTIKLVKIQITNLTKSRIK